MRSYRLAMAPVPAKDLGEPVALRDRAYDNLRFIRRAMENAGSFTAVPGWGVTAMGLVGGFAALMAHGRVETAWLGIWLGAAGVALLIGTVAMVRKARAAGVAIVSGPGRKFVLSLSPPMLAAAAITVALYLGGHSQPTELMPGLWLLLYGTGIATAGAFSIRIVPVMGLSFMVVGAAALFTPGAWGDLWMGLGFGGLHVGFGMAIARRHGG